MGNRTVTRLGWALAVGLSLGSPALADPPRPASSAPGWTLAWRRTCRTYARLPGLARDRGGDTVRWCFGRFGVASGRYLGRVPADLATLVAPTVRPDGRELVVVRVPGAGTRLRVELQRAHSRRRELAHPSLASLTYASLAPDGAVAVVDRDGRTEVVSLPSGEALVTLPPRSGATFCARSPGGDRLAVASSRGVTVYVTRAGGWVPVARLAEPAGRVVFSRDGRTLVAERGDGVLLSAWREGAGEVSSAEARVRFSPPPGFRAGLGAPPWLPSRAGVVPRREHGLVGQWSGRGTGVAVYATDASELAAFEGRRTGWVQAVMDRYAAHADAGAPRYWQDRDGARTVEWSHALASGRRVRVRVRERGGTLYRVELARRERCPRGSGAACEALVAEGALAERAFLTEPFGPAPGGAR